MGKTDGPNTKSINGQAGAAEKHRNPDLSNHISDQENVTALKKEITRLEADNKKLREQVAAPGAHARQSVQPDSDSLREQQHKFIKYSNVRRF